MGLYHKANEDIKEVDVIIAGGGTAACVVAGRLAKADPNLSILVIEGGTNNYEVTNVVNPALFLTHLAPTSTTAIFYKANKAKQLADRECIVPSGGILGGGSSINFMLYTRAQRSDFDSFKQPGWSADEMWPYLKRLETYHGRGESKDHGYDGPVHISDGGFRVKRSEDDIIQAAGQVGYPDITDLQNLETNNGFERWQRYVSPEGKRQDTAHTYLHPLLQDGKHPNLHVLVESKVLRVLFDKDNRACGVEYTPNPDYQAEIGLTKHPKEQVKARKMVIVSCGACGSPSVLERSGVGSKEVLDRAGVPVVADVPGVGNDYQDHNLIFYPYKTDLEPHETNDAILSGRLSVEEAIKKKNPILGWNTCDVSSKIRPTEEEVDALGPEFRAAWDRDFKDQPNRPLMLMALVGSYLGDQSAIEPGQYVSMADYTAYPYSRGHLHITGPELSDPLDFDVGFFTDPHDIDLKKQVWAYKKQREIMRRTKMYRGEIAEGHPRFPEGSKAACNASADSNGHSNGHSNDYGVTDLQYSAEDDAAIEQFLRENINTTWHSIGTAKMGAREEMGACDAELNVHGVKGLKIIDLSVLPENVAANTNNTAIAVGEKGADLVARELGILKPGEMFAN